MESPHGVQHPHDKLQSDLLLSPEELADVWPGVESATRAGFCGDSGNMVQTGFIYVKFLAEGTHVSLGV